MHSQATGLGKGGPLSMLQSAPLVPLAGLVVVVLVLLFLSEQASADVAGVLFTSVDRGLCVSSLVPFVAVNVILGTMGFSFFLILVAGGFLFGFWGGIFSIVISELLTTTSCFVIGRYLLRGRCRAWYESQTVPAEVQAAVSKLEQQEVYHLVLFRSIPMLPAIMKNYLPPLLNVNFASCVAALCVECAAYTPWFSYFGMKSESLARAYAKSHSMIPFSSADPRPLAAAEYSTLACSTAVLAAVLYQAARELRERDEGTDLSGRQLGEEGTVLSPLVALDGHVAKPFREHQRL